MGFYYSCVLKKPLNGFLTTKVDNRSFIFLLLEVCSAETSNIRAESLLKMNNLKPHPRPTASEFAFLQDAQVFPVHIIDWEVQIYTSTYILVPTEMSHGLVAGKTPF